MDKLFNLDSPVMRALNKMADLLWLNVLTLLLCIPVITGGAAITAMHYNLLKLVRGDEGYITRSFFKSFKDNFVQSTILWLICLAVFGLLGADVYLVLINPGVFPRIMLYLMLAVLFLVYMIFQYIFPLQSRFENPVRRTLKNSAILAIANLPKTLAMTVITIAPALIFYLIPQATPLVLMFGFTAPGYVCALMYSPIFKKFEPEEETEYGYDGEPEFHGIDVDEDMPQESLPEDSTPDLMQSDRN